MINPFESIETRLNNIENLLLDLKHSKNVSSQPEPDRLLTVDQCAEFLNLSKPTIYGLISRREIPFMKRGKRCYFSKTELFDYLKEGRRKTAKEIKEEAEETLSKKGGVK